MSELFFGSDYFISKIEKCENLEALKELLEISLLAKGWKLYYLSIKDFLLNLPLLTLHPFDDYGLNILLTCPEFPGLFGFFFDLVSIGLIEKKFFPVIYSQAYRFELLGDVYYTLQAKIHLDSELELSLCLENYDDYCKKINSLIRFPAISSKPFFEQGEFLKEIKKGLALENFLKICNRWKSNFTTDAWSFFNKCTEKIEFILHYPTIYITKIVSHIYRIVNLKYSDIPYNNGKINFRLMHIKSEFQGVLGRKLVCIIAINLKTKHEIFDMDGFINMIELSDLGFHLEKYKELNFEDWLTFDLKLYYLELRESLEKIHTVDFFNNLKAQIKKYALKSIKQMSLPLFKPTNEEEILKDFVLLSKQVTHYSDIPHVIIHFEQHDLQQLLFRVVLVGIFDHLNMSLKDYLEDLKINNNISIERSKSLGVIDKKFHKEACVCCFRLNTELFIRDDYTVDFQKARLTVMQSLMKIFGPVRDYEGGMIAKQAEAFSEFETKVKEKTHAKLITLENFFYGVYPSEYRSMLKTDDIVDAFLWWKKEKNKKAKNKGVFIFFNCYQSEMDAQTDITFFQEKIFKIDSGFWLQFQDGGRSWLGAVVKDKSLKDDIIKKFSFLQSLHEQ